MAIELKKVKMNTNRKTKRSGLRASRKNSNTANVESAYNNLNKSGKLKLNRLEPGLDINSEILNSLGIKVRFVNKKRTLLNEEEPSDSIENFSIDKSEQLSKLNKNMTNLEEQIPGSDDPFYKPDEQKSESYKSQTQVPARTSVYNSALSAKAISSVISTMHISKKVSIL